ncbi:MAG: hypothetical protein Q4C60_02495 [Eubacteriales bacterium]|nr:hypothetical protein [Eubacteriales bacterium]
MIAAILSFAYIALLCFVSGIGFRKAFFRLLSGTSAPALPFLPSFVRNTMTGVVLLTVYAEYFSLFYKVGMLCHLLLLALCALSGWYARREIRETIRELSRALRPLSPSFPLRRGVHGGDCTRETGGASRFRLLLWLFVSSALLLIVAFYTSRGAFHTDTNIYHAQAIRLYEEYGMVKGIGNLQLHFAYNSSYLAFCALFTLSWLLPFSLHTTTGFLTFLLCLYALLGLRGIHRRSAHLADAVRLALLLYAFTNITGAMSPATDYGTMYLVLYLLLAWAELTGRPAAQTAHRSPAASASRLSLSCPVRITEYGLLAVLSLFIVSMKFSAAVLVLFALYPLYLLITQGSARQKSNPAAIALFLMTGFLSFLPFLIRNYYISGWLFYPFESIDLFDVEWKIPVAYSLVDSTQIKVWGRSLEDVSKADWGFLQWFPVWWRAQEMYARLLLFSAFFATLLLGVVLLYRRLRRRTDHAPAQSVTMSIPASVPSAASAVFAEHGGILSFYAVLYCSLALWFFTAPFIRYGLAFLLVLPLAAVASFLSLLQERAPSPRQSAACPSGQMQEPGRTQMPGRTQARGGRHTGAFDFLLRLGGCALCLLALLSLWPHIAHYAGDNLKFIREYGSDSYWILPKPFDDGETASVDWNGNTIYYNAGDTEINSYYNTPSTCYLFMLERTELIGETIQEGFRAK